jgi:hypothetical protein
VLVSNEGEDAYARKVCTTGVDVLEDLRVTSVPLQAPRGSEPLAGEEDTKRSDSYAPPTQRTGGAAVKEGEENVGALSTNTL